MSCSVTVCLWHLSIDLPIRKYIFLYLFFRPAAHPTLTQNYDTAPYRFDIGRVGT